jgi:serine/threonine-protein kinase
VTGVGVLLGTAAYMPPEQARGKPVDKRADIWAFGCVLFEMLTGKRCFHGDDVSLTLAEVIKSEPDWNALPAGLSPAVQSTLKRCLQKDPKLRARDIGDVRLALDGGFGLLTAHLHDRPSPPRTVLTAVALAGSGIALGVIATAALLWRPASAPPAAPLTRFLLTLPTGSSFRTGVTFPLAVTRDGRRVVMNIASSGGKDQVYVRALDDVEPRPVPGLEGVVGSIVLSPDGEWVAYVDASRSSLKKMRLTGGPPQPIAEIGGPWLGGDWGAAGTIVFATRAASGLIEVMDKGGERHPRTNPPETERHLEPHFLPDGRSLLFTVDKPGDPPRIAYLPAGTSDYVGLIEGTNPRYVSSGHLLFTRDQSIWAVRFDATTGRTSGDPVPVLQGASVPEGFVVRASISAEGTLAYVVGVAGAMRTVVRVDRNGHEEQLPGLAPNNYGMIRVSPDGTRLAYVAGSPPDLWTYDFTRGSSIKVTSDDAIERTPLWTQDSLRLVYSSAMASALPDLYVRNADGTGKPERFLSQSIPGAPIDPEAWSVDGKTLVVSVLHGRPDVAGVNLEGGPRLRDLIATPSVDVSAAVSPDGHWLAYQSDTSGTPEVYIERFPELGDRQRISISGGMMPRWASKGGELFYQSVDGRQVFGVPISSGTKLTAGTPTRLFEGTFLPSSPVWRPFDVTPDGRFILIKTPSVDPNASATVVVVQNWLEELKRLVP